jgi:hypothetical protein
VRNTGIHIGRALTELRAFARCTIRRRCCTIAAKAFLRRQDRRFWKSESSHEGDFEAFGFREPSHEGTFERRTSWRLRAKVLLVGLQKTRLPTKRPEKPAFEIAFVRSDRREPSFANVFARRQIRDGESTADSCDSSTETASMLERGIADWSTSSNGRWCGADGNPFPVNGKGERAEAIERHRLSTVPLHQ